MGERCLVFHPVNASNVVHCYVEDITERLNLEASCCNPKKESVGQLAAESLMIS